MIRSNNNTNINIEIENNSNTQNNINQFVHANKRPKIIFNIFNCCLNLIYFGTTNDGKNRRRNEKN